MFLVETGEGWTPPTRQAKGGVAGVEGSTGDVRFAMIYVELSDCWSDELPSATTGQSSASLLNNSYIWALAESL